MFDWNGWRAFNCSVYVSISHAFGIPAYRISYDTFLTLGRPYCFATSCTGLDAYLGSIPLLWEWRRSFTRNCAFLIAYFLLFFPTNLLRLAAGMLDFHLGRTPGG